MSLTRWSRLIGGVVAVAASTAVLMPMGSVAEDLGNHGAQSQPAPGAANAGHDWLEPIVHQGVLDAFAMPDIKDGRADTAIAPRTGTLLQFVLDDYKRRVGEKPDGPAWEHLSYSVVAYGPDGRGAVHADAASGSMVFVTKGSRGASCSMVVLAHPGLVEHALVQAVMTTKDGGFYAAEWDLEWSPAGWHATMSVTPSIATQPRLALPVK
jgi:hypothetical protein